MQEHLTTKFFWLLALLPVVRQSETIKHMVIPWWSIQCITFQMPAFFFYDRANVIAEAGEGEELLMVNIDLEAVKEARMAIPIK